VKGKIKGLGNGEGGGRSVLSNVGLEIQVYHETPFSSGTPVNHSFKTLTANMISAIVVAGVRILEWIASYLEGHQTGFGFGIGNPWLDIMHYQPNPKRNIGVERNITHAVLFIDLRSRPRDYLNTNAYGSGLG